MTVSILVRLPDCKSLRDTLFSSVISMVEPMGVEPILCPAFFPQDTDYHYYLTVPFGGSTGSY